MVDESIYKELLCIMPKEKIFIDEPMRKHTTFKIGGNSDFFIIASQISEVQELIELKNKKNIPLTLIGNGSNILVRDNGIRGITLKLDFKTISKKEDGEDIIYTCGSGVSLSKMASIALEDEMAGLEFAYGIPGSIGGAVYMNAGANGGEIKDVVIESTYIDGSGNIHTIDNQMHEFSYRNSIFQKNNGIVLETKIKLQKGNKEEIKQKMQEYMKSRQDKQPLDFPSAGSVFKRGENFIAAKLIDECGLKGKSIGDAQVSEKHAGFIINKGNAKAADVIELMSYIVETVKDKTGYEIKSEIEIIGD